MAPAVPDTSVPTLISETSLHELPFDSSTCCVFGSPPTHIAEVEIPFPSVSPLPVFKSPVSLHELPFHNSVSALPLGTFPPKINPAVVVPACPAFRLALLISDSSVQDEPLYYSTSDLSVCPPANKQALGDLPIPAPFSL